MRYVRTKDGCITKGNFEIGEMILTLNGDEQITKENTANTLNKLIDEYVLTSNPINVSRTLIKIDFRKKIIYQWRSPKDVAEYTFEQFLPFHTIYGAIWGVGENNEPILKSVAKINEKGKLELL